MISPGKRGCCCGDHRSDTECLAYHMGWTIERAMAWEREAGIR